MTNILLSIIAVLLFARIVLYGRANEPWRKGMPLRVRWRIHLDSFQVRLLPFVPRLMRCRKIGGNW